MVKERESISAHTIYKTKSGYKNNFVDHRQKLKSKVKLQYGRNDLKYSSKKLFGKKIMKRRFHEKLPKIINAKTPKNISKIKGNVHKFEKDVNVNKDIYSNLCFDDINGDSITKGMELFEQILKPVGIEYFFSHFWEKAPCLIRKNYKNFFVNLTSFAQIDEILRRYNVEFTKNIDVTTYKNDTRTTLNPEGRALPPDVWNFYNNGCSIRFLNPQTFMPFVYKMNATLQEYFHCLVGANVYLTPPESQGFAPHYDDIEAFVLQIEGEKRWKLYAPRSSDEQLPRYSSKNLSSDSIGVPIFDALLKAGDVLYFPRGIIHQAFAERGNHSLHITLSVYQKQTYGDLLEFLLPMTVSNAIERNINLRKGLPLNIWRNFGSIYCNTRSPTKDRDIILKECKQLLKQIIDNISLDNALDQFAKKYQHDALPPILSQNETNRTVFGNKTLLNSKGKIKLGCKINLKTHIRLLRANIMRLVEEENVFRIYYYVDNSREFHEYEPNFIEVEGEYVFVVCQLIKSYPNYVKVMDLSLENDAAKIEIAQFFWGRGLLMTRESQI